LPPVMRDFHQVKRIVIKVGTGVLTQNGAVDTEFMQVIADQITQLVRQHRQVILVTSGAIGMGINELELRKPAKEVKLRQACAAVGQVVLMHEYKKAFSRHGQKVAQVLLTNRIMSQRKYYVNLKNAMETLLGMGIVPIVNENDCVSIEEIDLAFGDNDMLSALVASKIDAELLIILTDVEGLYNDNPRKNRQAKLIPVVYEISEQIEAMAGRAGTLLGTGGMMSKIAAIRIASQAGCKAVLTHGRMENVILRIVQGEEIGTLFLPKRRLSNRKRWILTARAEGVIHLDGGAAAAIKNHHSLLLVGVTGVEGDFAAGEVVKLGEVAKGVADVSAVQLRRLLEEKGENPAAADKKSRAVVHINNLVILG